MLSDVWDFWEMGGPPPQDPTRECESHFHLLMEAHYSQEFTTLLPSLFDHDLFTLSKCK